MKKTSQQKRSQLTVQAVRTIQQSNAPLSVLAAQFNRSERMIRKIKKGEAWQNIVGA